MKCDYCGKVGRRDKITSHIQKYHPAKDFVVTTPTPKDLKSIDFVCFLQNKGSHVDGLNTNTKGLTKNPS